MLNNIFSLKGRTAIVTGATGFLGHKICYTLSELGANLIMIDKEKNKKAELLLKKFKNKYKKQNFNFLSADFLIEQDMQKLLLNLKKFKNISILINNAAYTPPKNATGYLEPFEKQSTKMWQNSFDVNLKSVFEITQAMSKELKKNSPSSIVNISSIYGVYAPDLSIYKGTKMQNPASYAASKAGLIQLTKWLSKTLSPKINVNSISLGGILRGQNKKFIRAYSKKTSIKRMANEEDIVGIIALLASDASDYITGQNIIVDGGWGN